MEQQTTIQPRQQQDLVDLLLEKEALIKAQKTRIEFLEFLLAEREQLTENKYSEQKGRFNQMQDLAYRIFLDSPEVGFTYEEAVEEWERRYPHLNSTNLPRRIRELSEKGLLWRSVDPESGKVRHYLKKEEQKATVKDKLEKAERRNSHGNANEPNSDTQKD